MKCITKDGEVKRVRNDLADKQVSEDGWKYCPKSEWKAVTRKQTNPTQTSK